MHNQKITGSWTGNFTGTLSGGITLELNHSGNHITGIARMHVPTLGRIAYDIKGDAQHDGPFQFTFSRGPGVQPLNTIHTLCWRESDGSLSGRWKSENDNKGTFTATLLTRFGTAKAGSSPQHAPAPRPKPTLPHTPHEKSTKQPIIRMPARSTLSLQKSKPVVLSCHDKSARQTVTRFLGKIGITVSDLLDHTPIDSMASRAEGLGIIDDKVGFSVVVLTPDNVYFPAGKPELKKAKPSQNVIWELGFLSAKLGPGKVLVLTKGNPTTPPDLLGLGYEPMDQNDGWKLRLARGLEENGYLIDLKEAL